MNKKVNGKFIYIFSKLSYFYIFRNQLSLIKVKFNFKIKYRYIMKIDKKLWICYSLIYFMNDYFNIV